MYTLNVHLVAHHAQPGTDHKSILIFKNSKEGYLTELQVPTLFFMSIFIFDRQ